MMVADCSMFDTATVGEHSMKYRSFLRVFIFSFIIGIASANPSGFYHYVDYTATGGSTSQTNAQIPIMIYTTSGTSSGNTVYIGNNLTSSLSDIRFTSNTSDTLYNYSIEIHRSTQELVYVQVPNITANTTFTIRLWYNNPNAADLSNGTNTWDYYNDFTGTSSHVWQRQGIVVRPTPPYTFAVEPSVVYDSNPQILRSQVNVFKGWFREGYSNDKYTGIFYGESADGVNWTMKSIPVLSQNNVTHALFCPFVWKINNTTFGMFVHNGWNYYDLYRSSDGVNWTIYKSSAISTGTLGQWDDGALGNICTIWDNSTNQWDIIYEACRSDLLWKLGLATSPDLQTFTKYGSNPIIAGVNNSINTGMSGGPFLQKLGNTYWLWAHYAAQNFLHLHLRIYHKILD